jgi:hypothetical protein
MFSGIVFGFKMKSSCFPGNEPDLASVLCDLDSFVDCFLGPESSCWKF